MDESAGWRLLFTELELALALARVLLLILVPGAVAASVFVLGSIWWVCRELRLSRRQPRWSDRFSL